MNVNEYLPHVIGPTTGVGSEESKIEFFREALQYWSYLARWMVNWTLGGSGGGLCSLRPNEGVHEVPLQRQVEAVEKLT